MKVKMIHPLPAFRWKDGKVFGPYDGRNAPDLPDQLAKFIIRKGRAIEVKNVIKKTTLRI